MTATERVGPPAPHHSQARGGTLQEGRQYPRVSVVVITHQRRDEVLLDAADNVVLSDDPDHVVALLGVRDSVVVATRDVTMVCPVGEAERVKVLLAEVEARYGSRYS